MSMFEAIAAAALWYAADGMKAPRMDPALERVALLAAAFALKHGKAPRNKTPAQILFYATFGFFGVWFDALRMKFNEEKLKSVWRVADECTRRQAADLLQYAGFGGLVR